MAYNVSERLVKYIVPIERFRSLSRLHMSEYDR